MAAAAILATGRLFAFVPNIDRELPVSSNPLPHHDVFATDFLRCWTLGFHAEGADLARRRRSQSFHVNGRDCGIADLVGHTFPHCTDCSSAFYHARTRWKRGRV